MDNVMQMVEFLRGQGCNTDDLDVLIDLSMNHLSGRVSLTTKVGLEVVNSIQLDVTVELYREDDGSFYHSFSLIVRR